MSAYRKAYIKALKEKARKEARKRALAPSFGEVILNMLINGKRRGIKKKAPSQKTIWFNPPGPIIDKSTGPDPFVSLTTKKKRWW